MFRKISALIVPFLLLILFSTNTSLAQSDSLLRCGMQQWLDINMDDPEFVEQFRQTEARLKTESPKRNPTCSDPLIIPVAIHWNGDIIDVPCLMDIVNDQIQVMNEDFGGYNADITNYCDHAFECPDEYPFTSVTGGTCIQFCLATQNHPAGSGLSDGDPAFTFGQYTFDTYAPPWSGYMNIFVSNIPPNGYGGSLLGVAPLGGAYNPNGNGFYVHSRAFGGYENECQSGSVTLNYAQNYDLGRTAVHEAGHYFGLYHTFQGCGWGDGIADTPSQSQSNSGTPSINYSTCESTANNSCGTQDFFFNYMDYTYDEAMYMFTSNQGDKMYDVATSGAFNTAATVCGTLPNSYSPTYPGGCYVCPVLTIDAGIQNVSCLDACDGSITIDDVIEGVGPFVYEWSTGESTQTISDLCPGDYFVTITDVYGCEVIDLYTITEPELLEVNPSGTDETGNDFEDGTASADPSGGTEPYFYDWNNGQTTQTIENLAPGTYTVTITDVNGCIAIDFYFVEEFICPDLSIQAFQQNVSCNGDCNGELEVTFVQSGVEPYEYSWSNGAIEAAINDLCAGDYTVSITDSVNCTVISETYSISEPIELVLSVNASDESANDANDGTAIAYANGGSEPYSYAWSNGATTDLIENLEPGVYYVTMTDNNSCEKMDSVTINEFECPEIDLSSSQEDVACFESCDGSIELLVESEGNFFYDWSNGSTSASVSDLCAGSYEVTVSDEFNCNTIEYFYIEEPDLIEVELLSADESAYQANDGSAEANSSGGTAPYTYLWSNGATTQTVENLAPGTYSVTITDANSCQEIRSVEIAAYICPSIHTEVASSDASCFGYCDGSITINNVENGTAPYTFLWSNGATTQTIDALCAGDYVVTVIDSKNCGLVESYSIDQPDQISITIDSVSNVNTVYNGSISISGNDTYTYEWTGENGYHSTEEDVDDLEIGCYTLVVTDTITNCSIDTTICVLDFTSVDNGANNSRWFEVFPNPVKSELNVLFRELDKDVVNLQILDLSGKNLLKFRKDIHQQMMKINTSKLPSGTYLLRVKSDRLTTYEKFIVIK